MDDLTDAQVIAAARPGESWQEARDRLFFESLRSESLSPFSGRSKRPDYLLPRPSAVRPELLESLRRFQQLSPADQLRAWGLSRPQENLLDCPALATLVVVGLDWNACAVRLPYEDTRARLHYLVSVDYDDWLTCCRYTPWGWARVSDTSLVSGVTHWRIARDQERVSRVATRAEVRKLRELRNA